MNKKHLQRFLELEKQAESILASKHKTSSRDITSVDQSLLDEWQVKVRNLLAKSCGKDSEHYIVFIAAGKPKKFDTNYTRFNRLNPVFRAAKEDYEGGYLISIKALIQAEVFESELEQAQELLNSGYRLASAVISGIVLETSLRELCNQNSIPHSNLDKMNADLAKKGIYNKLQQKRITVIANIRNSAAHGKPDEFTNLDVESMIKDIERFLLTFLSE